MANPSTAPSQAASAVVDEAVRIAAEGSRRTTESAQAALQATRGYLEQASQLNRDLFALFTAGAEASFQTTFQLQNANLASAEALFDSYVGISKTTFARATDFTRQAQETTLKTLKTFVP
jgi:hypothetical protein